MSGAPRRKLYLILVFLLLSSAGLAGRESWRQAPASTTTEETALRALVEEFFAAYTKKDLDRFMSLWSNKSPELQSRRQAYEKHFVDHEKIEVESVAIHRMSIDRETAQVRIKAETSAVEARAEATAAAFGKGNRTLHLVKEEGGWKVWQEASSEEELATALVAAKTEEERAEALGREKELVTRDLVQALIAQGGRLNGQGNHPQAITSYRLAQDIAEQIGDQAGVANAFRGIGASYYSQGSYAQALEHYEKSLARFQALNDQVGIARALGNIGVVLWSQGNYGQALEYFQKNLTLSESLDDRGGIARALMNVGIIHFSQGRYSQALEFYKQSLTVADALDDTALRARLLNNIGTVQERQGNYSEAMEQYQKSLPLSVAVNDKWGYANTLANIGIVHELLGNYVDALDHFQKSLTLHEASGHQAAIASRLNSIGVVHRAQGNYAQALAYYGKSLRLKESLGDKEGVANTLANAAVVHNSQGNDALALDYLQKGLAVYGTSGNEAGIANMLGFIGEVYSLQGNYAQALESFQKSLTLIEFAGDRTRIASTLGNIGVVHRLQGKYPEALEYHQKSLVLAEDLGNRVVTTSILADMGEVYRLQGNSTQALEVSGRAAEMARQIGDRELLWKSHTTTGKVYRALQRPAEAHQALDDAIVTIETLRSQVAGGEQEQQRFFENKLSPYHTMLELLVAQNQISKALTYAERTKARALLDVLHSGRVNLTKAMTVREQDQERKLNNELVSLNTQIYRENLRPQPDQARLTELNAHLQRARLDYEASQTSLYSVHPELKVKRGESPALTLDEAGVLLTDVKRVLLEFVVAEDKTYAFVLTRSGAGVLGPADLNVYTLEIKREELADRVTAFRRQLAQRDLVFQESARALYDLLLKPAQALLKDKTALTIVPDGVLWELPFQALQSAPTRYVIADQTIAYAPSLTVLREMVRLRSKRASPVDASAKLLAFGNPDLGKDTVERVQSIHRDAKLMPLPDAEREVKALGRLYGSESKIYTGKEAREERFKTEAEEYRILHLATHGFLNDASPMYSHLMLSVADDNGNEDGLLEARELMQLDLNADLVVLSACETARGRVGAGEGVIGLTWGLFVAGVPTTVVSQWKVDSASTTDLMVEFHRGLEAQFNHSRSQPSAAKALREAALKLLATPAYRHPFYWAGFVAVGDAF